MKVYTPVLGIPSIQVKELGETKLNAVVNKKETVEAFIRKGAFIVSLPLNNQKEHLVQFVKNLDGVILEGGEHVHPSYYEEEVSAKVLNKFYDQERDGFDLALLEIAFNQGLPIIGICRGMQLINVYFGGSLNQYFSDDLEKIHSQPLPQVPRNKLVHDIVVDHSSKLFDILGKDKITVNSRHSQSVKKLGNNLTKSSWYDQNSSVVESIEYTSDSKFILGLQWHLEDLSDNNSDKIISYFIDQARRFRLNKTDGK